MSTIAGLIILLISVSAISSVHKIAKQYQDRKTLQLKHRLRMELLAGAKDLVGLLLLDKELGETVIKELREKPEVKALPPSPELNVVVHWAQRVQQSRRMYWKTACGLRSDQNNFVHTQGQEFHGITCKSCQRLLLSTMG